MDSVAGFRKVEARRPVPALAKSVSLDHVPLFYWETTAGLWLSAHRVREYPWIATQVSIYPGLWPLLGVYRHATTSPKEAVIGN